jgi:hypothetical protein
VKSLGVCRKATPGSEVTEICWKVKVSEKKWNRVENTERSKDIRRSTGNEYKRSRGWKNQGQRREKEGGTGHFRGQQQL